MADTASRKRPGALLAIVTGARDGFRHWRLLLIGWLVGLLPAAFASLPVIGLAGRLFGRHPDASRIVGGEDLAPLVDALMGLGDGDVTEAMASIVRNMGLAILVAGLLAPWLTGMLVASLRERRALGFGELWAAGWSEYGRQFRLLLVALIPAAVVAVIASFAGMWARHGSETQILESVAARRLDIAMLTVAVAGFVGWLGIECARAVFAADPALRSAFRAWLRGLHLLLKRPFAVLLAALLFLAVGFFSAMLLQRPALAPSTPGILVLACAQLAVLVLWWTRVARLSALAILIPDPSPSEAAVADDPAPMPPAVA